jgi:hypothetical protein
MNMSAGWLDARAGISIVQRDPVSSDSDSLEGYRKRWHVGSSKKGMLILESF